MDASLVSVGGRSILPKSHVLPQPGWEYLLTHRATIRTVVEGKQFQITTHRVRIEAYTRRAEGNTPSVCVSEKHRERVTRKQRERRKRV